MSDIIEIIKMSKLNLSQITKKTIWIVIIITTVLLMFFGMTVALGWRIVSYVIFTIIAISWITLFLVILKKEIYPRTRRGLIRANLSPKDYRRIREDNEIP
jgi:hypothetical protein